MNSSPASVVMMPGRILAAVLQHRQRIIDPLIDRAHTDHSDDSAHDGPPVYLALLFDSGEALEVGPRLASLADHGPQPIADCLAVRNQLRAAPPGLLIEMQQLPADDHQTRPAPVPRTMPNSRPMHPIQRPEPCAAREVAEQHADDPANQQHEHQNDQPSDPGRDPRIGQQTAEMRLDQRTESPCRPDGDDPECQRHSFPHKTAQ